MIDKQVKYIAEIIEDTCNVKFNHIASSARDLRLLYCRMIFSRELKNLGYKNNVIAAYLNRSSTQVYNYLVNYTNENNEYFKILSKKCHRKFIKKIK